MFWAFYLFSHFTRHRFDRIWKKNPNMEEESCKTFTCLSEVLIWKMIVRISRCLYHARSNHQSLRTSTVYITSFPRPERFACLHLLILWIILILCSKFPFNYKSLLFSNCFMMNLKLPNWLHKEVVFVEFTFFFLPKHQTKTFSQFHAQRNAWFNYIWPVTIPSPGIPPRICTPGNAERDYNYNPELLIDHIYVLFWVHLFKSNIYFRTIATRYVF